MGARKTGRLVVIVLVVAVALWRASDSRTRAVVGGAIVVLIGLALMARKDIVVSPATMPSTVTSQPVLASLKAQRQVNSNLPDEATLNVMVRHLQAGHKIEAIKTLRDITHCGLREGKDLVEELDRVLKSAAKGA